MKKKLSSFAKSALTPVAGFLFAALLFTSCSKNEMDDLSPVTPEKTASLPSGRFARDNSATDIQVTPMIPVDGMISISHGECFGMCPDYSLTVSKEGIVVYTGRRNVGVVGTVTYRINADVANELALNMERGGFFNFQDHYNIVPDGQRNQTSLALHGKIKVVVDYGVDVPPELREMQAAVEKVTDVRRFVDGTVDPSRPNPGTN